MTLTAYSTPAIRFPVEEKQTPQYVIFEDALAAMLEDARQINERFESPKIIPDSGTLFGGKFLLQILRFLKTNPGSTYHDIMEAVGCGACTLSDIARRHPDRIRVVKPENHRHPSRFYLVGGV